MKALLVSIFIVFVLTTVVSAQNTTIPETTTVPQNTTVQETTTVPQNTTVQETTTLQVTTTVSQNTTIPETTTPTSSVCDTPNYHGDGSNDNTFVASDGTVYNMTQYHTCNGHGVCVNQTCFCLYKYAGNNCSYHRLSGWRAFGYGWLCLLPGGCGVDRFYLGHYPTAIGKTILGLSFYICLVLLCVFGGICRCMNSKEATKVLGSLFGCLAACAALAILGWWIRDLVYTGKGWFPDSNGVLPYY